VNFVPKRSPESVLGENATKVIREDMPKVENKAVAG
jgi:hypothetical protein